MKFTLAFDVYGTVINTSGVHDLLKTMLGESSKSFMDAWRNKQLEYSFRRGLMDNYVDFSICTKQALEFCCIKFNAKLNPDQKASLMSEYKILPPFPDVEVGLQNLKKAGHSLYAFSNGSRKAVSELLENAGIIKCFDGIVSVEDIKMFKPSPSVYEHLNIKTNSTKSDSWLISGNPFDVIGAISYGMRSAWIQRSSDSIFDPWEIQATTTIKEFADLEMILAKYK